MADPNFSIPCYYYQTCPPAFTPPPYAFHPFQPPDYSPPTPPYFYHQPQPPPHTPPTSYTPYTTPTPYIEIYPKSLIMEEEQQKGMKNFDEVKAQIAQLANTSEDNNKKFEKMMEGMDLLIRSLKGENLEIHEGSSSNYHPKQMPSENTGYPPGFNPQTPTNFGTQNDQAEEMGLNNRRNEDTNGGMNSADAETINQMQYSSISINPKVRVNSIQNSNVCLPSSASYMTPHLNLPTLMFEEMSERVEIVDMEIKFEVGNASVSILGENVVFNGSGTGVTLEGEIDVEEDEVGRDFDIGDVETEMKPGSEEFRKEEGSENGSVLKGMDEDGVVIQKGEAKRLLVGLITMASDEVQNELIRSFLSNNEGSLWHVLQGREGIQLLISLLGLSSEQQQECAVALLSLLCNENDESKWAITTAGGIPPLVQILEIGFPKAKEDSATILGNLCNHSEDIREGVESTNAGLVIRDIFLWNPTTKKYRKLPAAPADFHCSFGFGGSSLCGFGYDAANDDYKVMRIQHDDLLSDGPTILSIDIGAESNMEIPMPKIPDRITVHELVAVIAYDLDKKSASVDEENVLVFDPGGGTFDAFFFIIVATNTAAEVALRLVKLGKKNKDV